MIAIRAFWLNEENITACMRQSSSMYERNKINQHPNSLIAQRQSPADPMFQGIVFHSPFPNIQTMLPGKGEHIDFHIFESEFQTI